MVHAISGGGLPNRDRAALIASILICLGVIYGLFVLGGPLLAQESEAATALRRLPPVVATTSGPSRSILDSSSAVAARTLPSVGPAGYATFDGPQIVPRPAPAGTTYADPNATERSQPESNHASQEAFQPRCSVCPDDVEMDLFAKYKYNSGGGYLSVASRDQEYTLNLQNQVTLDGTFFDRPNMPTSEQGFNIPFLRTYLFGNVTENWQYQIATQSFLGQFNILDAFVNWHYDDRFNIRVGRGLSPFLYEYYAFSPAWEPVITNSLLFQIAGKRQEGVMAWGNVCDGTLQYQAGLFNGISGAFYDLDRHVDFIGSIAWTPLANSGSLFEHFGIGAGVQTGQHNYALNQTGSAFTNGAGEPTTNINYITSSGIPWFQYDIDTQADGNQTKFAPQLFWFDRFSISTEFVTMSRRLSSGSTTGTTRQFGWYLNASYWLTGERYTGNGLAGYTTISPLNPFRPGSRASGLGAWEVAFQFSELSLNQANFDFTSTPAQYASRCDQVMLGVNWWPNKYTRFSLDNVFTWFDRAIPLGGNPPTDQFNTVWMRCAMFF